MSIKGVLPVPFLILILAAVVSLFSVIADRAPQAAVGEKDSLQIQTVEQERMAAAYFRVMAWLSDVMPQAGKPAKTISPSVPTPSLTKASSRCEGRGRIELCTFRSKKTAALDHRTPSVN